MAQQNEASVEEILESIKKVIARDNRVDALQSRSRTDGIRDGVQDDEPEAAEEDAEVLDLAEMQFAAEDASEDADYDADYDAEGDLNDTQGDLREDQTPLITEAVRGAMQENLAALAMISEPGARPQIVRSGETSLEGLTRELLRPMLAEWLEKNLPSMVEELVQAEIARIAGKGR
ncbi:MAG: DUF2497 domain-containing protein [Erythrobacter sp.]